MRTEKCFCWLHSSSGVQEFFFVLGGVSQTQDMWMRSVFSKLLCFLRLTFHRVEPRRGDEEGQGHDPAVPQPAGLPRAPTRSLEIMLEGRSSHCDLFLPTIKNAAVIAQFSREFKHTKFPSAYTSENIMRGI